MERKRFDQLVEQALGQLPEVFRTKLTNVAIIVEDRPAKEPGDGTLLLGLFHGIPQTEKSVFFAAPPDRIFLYQKNIVLPTPKSAGRFAIRCFTRSATTTA